jgi:hypothetical protein
MLVQRRLRFDHRGDAMRCGGGVIVPMDVRRTPAVLVGMDVPRAHGGVAAQRRVERVMRGLQFVLMLMGMKMSVGVTMFARAVEMRQAMAVSVPMSAG